MFDLANTDVLILCGGLGTRLRSTIGEVQKTMASVKDEPFLSILLKYLANEGFRRVILCTGYDAQAVEDYFRRQDLHLEIEFSREDKPLGTGGAVKNARRLVRSDPFIVMNGDSFCALDFKALLEFHNSSKGSATLAVCRLKGPVEAKDFGTLELAGNKKIIAYHEKTVGAGHKVVYVNAGIYCFNKEIFGLMPRPKAFSIEQEFFAKVLNQSGRKRGMETDQDPQLAQLHPFFGFEVEETFIDIGTPERYEQAKKFFGKISKHQK
jgi:NDP-sugar pyrophosphorylase family protein